MQAISSNNGINHIEFNIKFIKMWCHQNSVWIGYIVKIELLYPRSPKVEGGILFYLCPSVQDIFHRIFLSNCWWQKFDIWSQASYRYTILWEAFLDPSDSYFLFAEELGYQKWALTAHSSSCSHLFPTTDMS